MAQAFLIVVGFLVLLLSAPIAFMAWRMRAFGGDITTADRILLYSPFISGAAWITGLLWRNAEKEIRNEN